MKLTRNTKAISKLLLILLLLAATVIGAILSYLWVIGYYVSLDRVYPEDATVNITDYAFDYQNTSYFHVTIQCPTSYKSKETANVTRITVSTEDGVLHDEINTDPPLPYKFPRKGESQTLKCLWNWANYTGETIEIIAFVTDGSGPTFEAKTPLVDLEIIDPRFNSTISVTHFNMTIRNYDVSVTYVNVTEITVDEEDITPSILTLPYTLHPGDSVPFMCSWNWTAHQGKNVTIAVKTLQGYVAYYPEPPERTTLPSPVVLTITDVLFEVTNTTRFNVTIQYSEGFAQYVNITRITATLENGAPENITKSVPSLPHVLYRGKSVNFTCIWNWTDHREENVTITVHTLQDFTVSSLPTPTTARVILTITNVLFDVTDPSYFNITVRNSESSLEGYVNITRVTVTVENGTPENITIEPPITLYANKSVTFKCDWNWINYWNKRASITVHADGYSGNCTEVTLSPVIISDVIFDLSDTAHLKVVVKNSEFFSTYILITNVTVQDVTVVAPTRLPYVLYPNESVLFNCSWDWTAYCNQSVTITVSTLQGYVAYYTQRIPPIILEITDLIFDSLNTTNFNVTVRNSEFSLTDVNITEITVTVDGISGNITDTSPSLQGGIILPPGTNQTFTCFWNWSTYSGKDATIVVQTQEGYSAHSHPVLLKALTITEVLFNPADTDHFVVTVQNPTWLNFTITTMNATVEGMASLNITGSVVPSLPFMLPNGTNILFMCSWDWSGQQGKNVTVTIETLEGYTTSYTRTIPSE